MEGGSGIRSVYSILGVLVNRKKYNGQEHRLARTIKARTGKTSGIRLEVANQKKKLQTKDVEEVIKAYDGIVGSRRRCQRTK